MSGHDAEKYASDKMADDYAEAADAAYDQLRDAYGT